VPSNKLYVLLHNVVSDCRLRNSRRPRNAMLLARREHRVNGMDTPVTKTPTNCRYDLRARADNNLTVVFLPGFYKTVTLPYLPGLM
jgi:hypothetical protein